MSSTLTLPIDDDTLARIDRLASSRGQPRDSLVREALTTFLDEEFHALEQIRAGLEEAERGEFASDEEVERVFGKYRRE